MKLDSAAQAKLQHLIQTSSYSQAEVQEAFEYFVEWNERHQNKGSPESWIGFLECCAQAQLLRGDQRKFVVLVREMLEEFGYEGR